MYRAIILAAGRGSRMKEHTKEKPKCLNILANNTLLFWQLKSLKISGINDITVISGYKSDLLVGDFKKIINDRWSQTNMVSSLFCAPKSKFDSIISYSDIVYKSNHIDKLMKSKGDIVITADLKWKQLWDLRFNDPLSDAETFRYSGDKLIEIGGKTKNILDIQAQYMGLLKLTSNGWNIMKKVFDSFPENVKDKLDMTTMISHLLAMDIEIKIVFVRGGWCESDSYNDIIVYENRINSEKVWIHDWRK